jgi:DNA-binding response OmpR family regulator
MAVGLALLVSADPVAVQQFSLALRELSISPDACQDVASAALLLKRRKFDAVIVDLQLGEQSGHILDEARLSPSNRTAVTFGIGDNDAEVTRISARNHSLSSRDRFLRSQSTKRSSLLSDSS